VNTGQTAERRPRAEGGDLDSNSASASTIAALLELSDERDRYEQRILAAWRDGYRCGELAHACDYDRGVDHGIRGYKRATREIMEAARLQIRRYGPDSRQFTDPSPLDIPWLFRRGGAA
jgi:hypothetical protein